MSMSMEQRFTSAPNLPEIRVEEREDKPAMIVGYAAVFYNPSDPGTVYRMFDWLEERISPGAFDRAIKESHDARGLFNHQPANILGRVKSGTTRLSVDKFGLRYEIDVPDTQVGRDTLTSIKRGDISGSSFAFRATKVVWGQEVRDGKEIEIREIMDLDLGDVGPVTYPAYEATSADTRSVGANEQELRSELMASRTNAAAVNVNARIAELDLHTLS